MIGVAQPHQLAQPVQLLAGQRLTVQQALQHLAQAAGEVADGLGQPLQVVGAELLGRTAHGRRRIAAEEEGEQLLEGGHVLRFFDQRGAQGHPEALAILRAQRLDRAKGVGALGNRDAHPGRAQASDEVDDALFHVGTR